MPSSREAGLECLSREPLLQIGTPTRPAGQFGPRRRSGRDWERRARLLAWGGIGWHFVEFLIAVFAGLAAGSIALIGFGADSLIEAIAGFVVIWLFTGSRLGSSQAERRAQQMIAVSFYILAAYVGVESARTLVNADHPRASWVGIALAAFTARRCRFSRGRSDTSARCSTRPLRSRKHRRRASAPTSPSRCWSD